MKALTFYKIIFNFTDILLDNSNLEKYGFSKHNIFIVQYNHADIRLKTKSKIKFDEWQLSAIRSVFFVNILINYIYII